MTGSSALPDKVMTTTSSIDIIPFTIKPQNMNSYKEEDKIYIALSYAIIANMVDTFLK